MARGANCPCEILGRSCVDEEWPQDQITDLLINHPKRRGSEYEKHHREATTQHRRPPGQATAEHPGHQRSPIPPAAGEVHPLPKSFHSIQTALVQAHYAIENAAEIAKNEPMDPQISPEMNLLAAFHPVLST